MTVTETSRCQGKEHVLGRGEDIPDIYFWIKAAQVRADKVVYFSGSMRAYSEN